MPTYEYVCRACGHEFERFQRMSEPPVRSCPKCERRKVERLISAGGGILFKGPGFYATDYRKTMPPREGDSSSGSSKDKDEGGAADGGTKKKAPSGDA